MGKIEINNFIENNVKKKNDFILTTTFSGNSITYRGRKVQKCINVVSYVVKAIKSIFGYKPKNITLSDVLSREIKLIDNVMNEEVFFNNISDNMFQKSQVTKSELSAFYLHCLNNNIDIQARYINKTCHIDKKSDKQVGDYSQGEKLNNAANSTNYQKVKQILEEKNPQINKRNIYNLLMVALTAEGADILKILENKYPRFRDVAQFHPVLHAIHENKSRKLDRLLANGIDLNYKFAGLTPIQNILTSNEGVLKNDGKCAEYINKLIVAGADINIDADFGLTTLQIAEQQNKMNCQQLLLAKKNQD